jgi:hypothetical protein
MGAGVLSDAIAPINQSQSSNAVNVDAVIQHERIQRVISHFSPMLFIVMPPLC